MVTVCLVVEWIVVVTTEAPVPVPMVMVRVLEETKSVVVVVMPGGREVCTWVALTVKVVCFAGTVVFARGKCGYRRGE
jgi:hypothetical protein